MAVAKSIPGQSTESESQIYDVRQSTERLLTYDRRHEANHRKDAMFRCTIPDCQKEFQRIDLFSRHLEKQ